MKNIAYNITENSENMVFKLFKTKVPKLRWSLYKLVPVLYVDYVEGWGTFAYKFPFNIYLQKAGRLYNVSIGGQLTKLWYKSHNDFYNNIIRDIENIKQISVNLYDDFVTNDNVIYSLVLKGHTSKERGISRTEFIKLIREERAKNRK